MKHVSNNMSEMFKAKKLVLLNERHETCFKKREKKEEMR